MDINSYVITLIISLSLGSSFCFVGRGHHKNISLNDQITFIILSFIFIPLSFETTLRVVDKYDKYFFLSKAEQTNQYSIPEQIISGILELKLRSDWKRYFTKSIENRISSDIDAIQITLKEITRQDN